MTTPIRSILAATDLSPKSIEALQAAAALAALTEAELHVVHAVEPSPADSGSGVWMLRRIQDGRDALRARVQSAIPEQVRVSTAHVAFERAPAAILERAEQVRADLIVIGPHRTRAFGDQVLGTTADRLVRESTVPCLVVRGPLTLPLRRFLVPSDLSAVAVGSLAVALGWAEALQGPAPGAEGAELTVLHVDTPTASDDEGFKRSYERRSELNQEVTTVLRLRRPSRSLRVRQEFLQAASPPEEILRFAREDEVDLLIMGTRGDRPLVKTLVGSVSAAVARASEIPVLLIPPRVWSSEKAGTPGGPGSAYTAPVPLA